MWLHYCRCGVLTSCTYDLLHALENRPCAYYLDRSSLVPSCVPYPLVQYSTYMRQLQLALVPAKLFEFSASVGPPVLLSEHVLDLPLRYNSTRRRPPQRAWPTSCGP